jgi:hypothetical protein
MSSSQGSSQAVNPTTEGLNEPVPLDHREPAAAPPKEKARLGVNEWHRSEAEAAILAMRGRTIAEGVPGTVLSNPDVLAAYLGTEG